MQRGEVHWNDEIITCKELKNKYMDIYENHRDQVRYRALLNAEPG